MRLEIVLLETIVPRNAQPNPQNITIENRLPPPAVIELSARGDSLMKGNLGKTSLQKVKPPTFPHGRTL